MKKILTLIAAATLAVSASAQTVTESKTFDNFYIGINGGLVSKTTDHAFFKGLDPNVGVRVGRNFTPVIGLALEANGYFSNKPYESVGTAVRALNSQLLATVNMSNLFGGYKGEPRFFEVSALYGWGLYHVFGDQPPYDGDLVARNALTSKAGLDFAFNLGSKKAWQVYIEPAMIWAINGLGGHEDAKYNINNSYVQLNAGVIYKFKNSNGTHNFTLAQLRDQSEIDQLNGTINDLRAELAKAPKEVIKTVRREAPATSQEVKVENLVFVTFAQGKSVLTKDAKAALDKMAAGTHVQIVGTASPEGSKAFNDRLSQARADAVAKYLTDRGVIVDEATGKGVQGTTSNRLAIVMAK